MTFLRFTPQEYQAIAHHCQPLNLARYLPSKLKRFLVESLCGTFPELAQRLDRLGGVQMQILHQHFRECQPAEQHGLTAEEVGALAEVCGPILFHVRFIHPLRSALVRHFLEASPRLAAKLEQLNCRQFELLCEQIQQQTKEGA